MRKIGLAALGLVAATGSLHAQPDQYLCVAEQSAGVHYSPQTKAWQPQAFAPGRKYILRRLKGEEREGKYPSKGSPGGFAWLSIQMEAMDKSEWGFFVLGDTFPIATCNVSFQCTNAGVSLEFSQQTNRFETYVNSGFLAHHRALVEAPFPDTAAEGFRLSVLNHPPDGFINIGTCSAF